MDDRCCRFCLQILLIGVLVLIPLIFTEALAQAAVDDVPGRAATTATSATTASRGPGREGGERCQTELDNGQLAHTDRDSEEDRR